MDALLWVGMVGAYALCAWMWFGEFGKQFPRGGSARRVRASVTPGEAESSPPAWFKASRPTLLRS